MSGFAVVFDSDNKQVDESVFQSFFQNVAAFKSLTSAPICSYGDYVAAAKFNSPAARHRQSIRDEETGSWLLAVGTAIHQRNSRRMPDLSGLLAEFLSHGEEALRHCDGWYALVIYNGLDRSLSVISDPFGFYSVYYGSLNGRTFISTSSLAVARATLSQPSSIGVECFLQTGNVYGEMTLWQSVKRMEAASCFRFSKEKTERTTYWLPSVDESIRKLEYPDAVEASSRLLQTVFRKNLEGEKGVWADLTGGFDTRLMILALEKTGIPFISNTVGSQLESDVKTAEYIARQKGWQHRQFYPAERNPKNLSVEIGEALGQGDGHLNVLLLLDALWVRKQQQRIHPVLVTGLGGELWRGPLWWPEKMRLGLSTKVHYRRQLWSIMHPLPKKLFQHSLRNSVGGEILNLFRSAGERNPSDLNTTKLDFLWLFRNTAHAGAWTSFCPGLIRTLPVLFSKDIVNHSISLDYRWKIGKRMIRSVIEGFDPDLERYLDQLKGFEPGIKFASQAALPIWNRERVKRAGRKLGEILLQRPHAVLPPGGDFGRIQRRREILEICRMEGIFHPENMVSGSMYRKARLDEFLEQVPVESFPYEELFGRILTVELALRAVGSGIHPSILNGRN